MRYGALRASGEFAEFVMTAGDLCDLPMTLTLTLTLTLTPTPTPTLIRCDLPMSSLDASAPTDERKAFWS